MDLLKQCILSSVCLSGGVVSCSTSPAERASGSSMVLSNDHLLVTHHMFTLKHTLTTTPWPKQRPCCLLCKGGGHRHRCSHLGKHHPYTLKFVVIAHRHTQEPNYGGT